jgi:hypothetical protein
MTEEKRTCDGCGYEFKDGESPSAICNYGKGAGPHYWCSQCCPPLKDAKEIARMLEKFVKDGS